MYVSLFFRVMTIVFAVFGLCGCVRRMSDVFLIKKHGIRARIILLSAPTELSVRFLHSRFLSGDYACLFDREAITPPTANDEKDPKKDK